MTSRLKRKLENIGVDVQSKSARLTENFCLIGTPLPPLEKSKDTGEFVPLWKQDVRDEQGRRRLHGAFTGGFSAGYYNTVGSKEGWTPSTFVSSRADRASKKQAKPEDFMDEEDLAELRDSKKLVDTTAETDILGGTQAELARQRGAGEVEKDALESLLPPSKDSVGARLLKKMGWRPGQGIGPRVTYQQRRMQDGRPIRDDEPVDEEARKHLYAPRDTKTVTYRRKENAFGLGYDPGRGLGDIVQGSSGQAAEAGPKLSAGFGLGALNEAEDDDVDVYDQGLPRESRRMAYDAGENEDDERVTLHAEKTGDTSKASAKKAVSPSATFRDGRPVVSGFALSEKPLVEDRWFPIPDIPKGWAADPRRVWAKDITNEQARASSAAPAPPPPPPHDHRPWLKGKSADERGSLLGETPLPGAPRSVFDYLSQKDRDRLKNLAAGLAPGAAPPAPAPPPPPPPPASIPPTDAATAQAALQGFQPFAADARKQQRYTAYLHSQAGAAAALAPLPGQSAADFSREAGDYAQAARIFRPVAGAMAGRFASASTTEMLGRTSAGLHRPTQADYARLDAAPPENAGKGDEGAAESAQAHAARTGMFGPLTRAAGAWRPARLLCKRFGVKDPHPEGAAPGAGDAPPGATAKAQAWEAEVLVPAGAGAAGVAASAAAGEGSAAGAAAGAGRGRDLANVGLGDDEAQGRDTLTYERPAKDIFKAIFASDDEESGGEGEDAGGGKAEEAEAEAAAAAAAEEAAAAAKVAEAAAPSAAPAASGEPPRAPAAAQKVDLATFRPTFVPQAEREEGARRAGKARRKRRGKLVVSFDVDDAGGGRRGEKRPRRARAGDAAEDEGMWVEKPPPEVARNLAPPVSTLPDDDGDGDGADESARPARARKRAVDFL